MHDEIVNKIVEQQAPISYVDRILDLAANQDFDANKLEKMMDMQFRIETREAEKAFNRDLAIVQQTVPNIPKLARNNQTNSNYAKHEHIIQVITPILTQYGFSLSFTQDKSDFEKCIRIRATLSHRDGHSRNDYYVDVPIDDSGIKGSVNKTPTHAIGSSNSYGRRYLTCMILNLSTGDDYDGNAVKASDVICINDDQANTLYALIDETGSDKDKFLQYFKVGSIEELKTGQFNKAKQMLEAKR